jgi:hypothetical protein
VNECDPTANVFIDTDVAPLLNNKLLDASTDDDAPTFTVLETRS